MSEELARSVDVRDSVSVIVPAAGILMCAVVVTGQELVQMAHVRGNNLCIPGKWYVLSLSVNGKKLGFSRAMGEYASVAEAEKACKQLCRDLGKRVQDAMLRVDLGMMKTAGPRQ